MEYNLQISYLRRVPWYRRCTIKCISTRLWRAWYLRLMPVGEWLANHGISHAPLLLYTDLEYVSTTLVLCIEYTGSWYPPDISVGIYTAEYEIVTWIATYDTPADYDESLQDSPIMQLIENAHVEIEEAIQQYESDRVDNLWFDLSVD